jgi:hypothetical protein
VAAKVSLKPGFVRGWELVFNTAHLWGMNFFLQRRGQRAVSDPDLLAQEITDDLESVSKHFASIAVGLKE